MTIRYLPIICYLLISLINMIFFSILNNFLFLFDIVIYFNLIIKCIIILIRNLIIKIFKINLLNLLYFIYITTTYNYHET